MSQIRNYAVIEETSAGDLVNTVTKAITNGFHPIGGVSLTREPAKGTTAGRTVYAQAMVRLYTPADAVGQVVTRVNGMG